MPVDLLRVGDRVEVRAGELVPADGTIAQGVTAVDESILTGESTPIAKEGTTRFDNIAKYNEVAVEVMKEEGVAVNDLYTLVLPNRAEWQGADEVHFGPDGNNGMAQQVSANILQALGMPTEEEKP